MSRMLPLYKKTLKCQRIKINVCKSYGGVIDVEYIANGIKYNRRIPFDEGSPKQNGYNKEFTHCIFDISDK